MTRYSSNLSDPYIASNGVLLNSLGITVQNDLELPSVCLFRGEKQIFPERLSTTTNCSAAFTDIFFRIYTRGRENTEPSTSAREKLLLRLP